MVESPIHTYKLRVYFEDTDAGKVVYHAGYLRFAERARTEMLRDWGYPHHRLMEEHGLMFVVSRLEIDYASPARLDDQLEVQTSLAAIGGASVKLVQNIVGLDGAGGRLLRAAMAVRLACIDVSGRPARLPDEFIEKTKLATEANRI